MRLLFVLAHPLPESFAAALCRAATEAARDAGHEVRLIDLHAEGFDPVPGAEELRGYRDAGALPPDLRPHAEALRWAEGLIFVHPTWWQSQPAILKGWIDRVWRPGIAFSLPAPAGPMRPLLTNIRLIGVITTFGVPWWIWALLMGAPGRKILLRGLRPCTAPRTRTFWMGLHEMDSRDAPARARFVRRVQARMARLPV